MKRITLYLLSLSLIAALAGCENPTPVANSNDEAELAASADAVTLTKASSTVMFEVTLKNLAPATAPGASQIFSPAVLATHDDDFHIFEVGGYASRGLSQVAEDAVNGPMVDFLSNSDDVYDVVEGDGVVPPGAYGKFYIDANADAKYFSLVSMLVNTNDGFVGANAIKLPNRGEATYYLNTYDAGTEKNTELHAHIPGPCCGSGGVRVPTRERIKRHAGITGVGDLDPAVYDWEDPVAKLTIRRINPTYEVKIENMTPATGPGASQPMSPPVLATHREGYHMFQVGKKASYELAQIAQDAINGPMVDRLSSSRDVFSVTEGGGVILPGGYDSFKIEARSRFTRLSLATMLVNTNDAFAGLDGLKLPRYGSTTVYGSAYDAGSEKNTELRSDIPGPCCGSPGNGTSTSEKIAHHPGILGVGDLSVATYNWDDPVVKITITRVK